LASGLSASLLIDGLSVVLDAGRRLSEQLSKLFQLRRSHFQILLTVNTVLIDEMPRSPIFGRFQSKPCARGWRFVGVWSPARAPGIA
jgi:hypothetical protein